MKLFKTKKIEEPIENTPQNQEEDLHAKLKDDYKFHDLEIWHIEIFIKSANFEEDPSQLFYTYSELNRLELLIKMRSPIIFEYFFESKYKIGYNIASIYNENCKSASLFDSIVEYLKKETPKIWPPKYIDDPNSPYAMDQKEMAFIDVSIGYYAIKERFENFKKSCIEFFKFFDDELEVNIDDLV